MNLPLNLVPPEDSRKLNSWIQRTSLSVIWVCIHSLAYNSKCEMFKSIVDLYKNLDKVVKCKSCIVNYKKFLMINPLIDLEGDEQSIRDRLIDWTIALHNNANKDVYTKREWSREEIDKLYKPEEKESNTDMDNRMNRWQKQLKTDIGIDVEDILNDRENFHDLVIQRLKESFLSTKN